MVRKIGLVSKDIDIAAEVSASTLDNTAGGTDGETSKAPTSNVMYDHGVATTGIHGVGASTVDSVANRDSAISTHAALTTGVHGVGAMYVAKSTTDGLDVSAHASRHNWGGADVLSPIPLLFAKSPTMTPIESLDAWTQHNTGGTITLAIGGTSLQSGAATPNHCTMYSDASQLFQFTSGMILWLYVQINQATNQVARWYMVDNTALEYANENFDHMGFKVVNNKLYASNGQTTAGAETATEIATITTAVGWNLMVWHKGTSIEYYLNWVLAATHTTNLPTAGWEKLLFHIGNTAAENKIIYVRNIGTAQIG